MKKKPTDPLRATLPDLSHASRLLRLKNIKKEYMKEISDESILSLYNQLPGNTPSFYFIEPDFTGKKREPMAVTSPNYISLHSNEMSTFRKTVLASPKFSEYETKIINKDKKGNTLKPLITIYGELDIDPDYFFKGQVKKKTDAFHQSSTQYREETDKQMVENLEKWENKKSELILPEIDSPKKRAISKRIVDKPVQEEEDPLNDATLRKLAKGRFFEDKTYGDDMNILKKSSLLGYTYKDYKHDTISKNKLSFKFKEDVECIDLVEKQIEKYCDVFPSFEVLQDLALRESSKLAENGIISDSKSVANKLMQEKINENYSPTEKAQYYEKQTIRVEKNLENKIKDLSNFLLSKNQQIREYRIETSDIYNRLLEASSILADVTGKKITEDTIEATITAVIYSRANQQKRIEMMAKYVKESSIFKSRTLSRRGSRIITENNSSLITPIPLTSLEYGQTIKDIQYTKEVYLDLNHKLKDCNGNIARLEKDMLNQKKLYKTILNSKKLFLFNLLKQGNDVRNDGLCWILVELINLGNSLSMNQINMFFPDYLDANAKVYLIERARLEVELQELKTFQKTFLDIYKAAQTTHLLKPILIDSNNKNVVKLKPLHQKNKQSSERVLTTHGEETQPDESNVEPNHIASKHKNEVASMMNLSLEIPDYQGESSNIRPSMDHSRGAYALLSPTSLGRSAEKEPYIGYNLPDASLLANTHGPNLQEKIYNKGRKIIMDRCKIENNRNLSEEIMNTVLLEENPLEEQNMTTDTTAERNFSNNIKVFDNERPIMNFNSREEFIAENKKIDRQILDIKYQIRLLSRREEVRILREIDTKAYEQRFGTKAADVLSALFGAERAERVIIQRKIKEKN